MKKIFMTSALGSIMFVVAACGVTIEPKADLAPIPVTTTLVNVVTTVTMPPVTTPPVQQNPQDLYIDQLGQQTTLLATVPRATLVQLGWTICEFYGAGGTTNELSNMLIQSAINSGADDAVLAQYTTLVAVAVATLCPQYAPRV